MAREQAARATEDRQAAEEARAHSHRLDPDGAGDPDADADRPPPPVENAGSGPLVDRSARAGAPGAGTLGTGYDHVADDRGVGGRGMDGADEPAEPPTQGEAPYGPPGQHRPG